MDLDDPQVRDRLLADGPVGEWVTVPGTHTMLMHDSIVFRADGTGQIDSDSLLGGPATARFTWAVLGPGRLACTVADDDPDQEETERVSFTFTRRSSDTGAFWVMRDPDVDSFWSLFLPVVPKRR